jgi:hypothetical protein
MSFPFAAGNRNILSLSASSPIPTQHPLKKKKDPTAKHSYSRTYLIPSPLCSWQIMPSVLEEFISPQSFSWMFSQTSNILRIPTWPYTCTVMTWRAFLIVNHLRWTWCFLCSTSMTLAPQPSTMRWLSQTGKSSAAPATIKYFNSS